MKMQNTIKNNVALILVLIITFGVFFVNIALLTFRLSDADGYSGKSEAAMEASIKNLGNLGAIRMLRDEQAGKSNGNSNNNHNDDDSNQTEDQNNEEQDDEGDDSNSNDDDDDSDGDEAGQEKSSDKREEDRSNSNKAGQLKDTKPRYIWGAEQCESEFISYDGSDWFEIDASTKRRKFAFTISIPTPVGNSNPTRNYVIGISDAPRGMEIALTPFVAIHRGYHKNGNNQSKDIPLTFEEGKSGKWNLLCSGGWILVDGKEVDRSKMISPEWEGLNIDPSKRPPPPQHKPEDTPTASILILIASYRDLLCGNTLMEAFQHATNPDRVTIAVVQQIQVGVDPDCLEDYCVHDKNCRRNQVRMMTVPLEKSRGVMPGRFRQNLLIKDEVFCFQIDSHSVFPDGWDNMAIDDWYSTDNEMAVMTTYPNKVGDRHDQSRSPARCSTVFSGDKQVVYGGNSAMNMKHGSKPFIVPFFGAGISFSKCHANLNVPYDPYMGFLFGGEEFNRDSRLWTWGYDMYAPRKNYAYHFYDSEDVKPSWAQKPRQRGFTASTHVTNEVYTQTVARWRAIYGLTSKTPLYPVPEAAKDIELFGLGCRRSIKDFQKFVGVNLKTAEMKSRCDQIGKMPWVAWDWEKEVKDGDGKRFHPAGPACSSLETNNDRRCVTSHDLIVEKAVEMIELTNDQLLDSMEIEKYKNSNPEPFKINDEVGIISPHCAKGYVKQSQSQSQ